MEWSALNNVLGDPPVTFRLDIRVGPETFVVPQEVVFVSTTIITEVGVPRVGKNEYLTTGFIVGFGAVICPEVNVSGFDSFGDLFDNLNQPIRFLKLRGYLVKTEFVISPTD